MVAEAVTAAAWRTPYSFSRNFISDLGVTACVPRGPCSPLGALMNAGFVLSGALAILAVALLGPLIARTTLRRSLVAAVLTHGLGSVVVGLVHSAPATPAGTPRLHLLAAYAAIIGGNVALMLVGFGLGRGWASAPFRVFSVTLGGLGLVSGLTLVVTRSLPPGLLERGAVDTITLWEVSAGLVLGAVLLRRGVPGLPKFDDPIRPGEKTETPATGPAPPTRYSAAVRTSRS